MSCPNVTNTIENDKPSRKPYRGILTDTEKERIEKGQIKKHRQMKNIIKQKATVALMTDLPLILEKTDFRTDLEAEWVWGLSPKYAYTKILFNYAKGQIEKQRTESGVKRKVSNKQVWEFLAKKLGNYYEF